MKRHQLIALAAIVLVACVDGGRSNGPSFAISDATHGAGRNAFFYWLPPLVPAPTPAGDFNRFASPIVTVCELASDGTACRQDGGHPILVAQFSMTSGTGSEIIRVSLDDQLYVVNWHTDLSNLDPAKVYRITVTVDDRDYGFADVEVGLNAKELKNVNRDEFVPLVDGRTLPIKFRIEAGASCAGREASCAEAIVDPTAQETVILTSEAGVRLAFGDFPPGWADGSQAVRIERIPDAGFGAGQGPLGTSFPQFPLFFHYFTSAAEPFNLPVRIGVCNVEDPADNTYHPDDRRTTVLAMGGTPEEFRVLDRAPASDILGTCQGAERESSDIGAAPVRSWIGDLAAAIGRFAAGVLAPKTLQASAVLIDGGMGGSTEFFTPAGTVDTASADLQIQSFTQSPAEPTTTDLVTFTAVIRNAGASTAGASTAGIDVGGEPAPGQTFAVPTLAPGATFTIQRQITLDVAQAYLNFARVDVNNEVAESNEGNNEQSLSFTVSPGGIDLISVDLSSTTLTIDGEAVSYTATVRNGTGSTLETVVLQAWIDQGDASRAAGGLQVLCGAGIGTLPPGPCSFSFGASASNAQTTAGTGTLVPGSATARFELKQGETVFDVVRVPVTLVAP